MSMKDTPHHAINAVHRLNPPPMVEDMTSDENSSSLPVVPTLPHQKRRAESVKASPWLHFFAGGVGGMAGALCTSPLDVVKTRLQSDLYGSPAATRAVNFNRTVGPIGRAAIHITETFHMIRSVYQIEGARSLFKGLGPNLVGVIPARSINFFTYGAGKNFISETFNNGKEETWVHLAAAANAGIVTSTCTNPIWLVKTRLQLDKSSGGREYKNSWDCLVKVVKHEGIAGLYKGLSASYLGVVESSLQWVLYEQMKSFIRSREQHRIDRGLSSTKMDTFLEWGATSGAAGAAKFMASLMTYPHEVVRTRLRQAPMMDGKPKYKGLISCFRIIIKEEGLLSMYGGLTPHLLRTVPNSIIMFGTFELIVGLFSK